MNLKITEFSCAICGGNQFEDHIALWPELIAAWEISEQETAYINQQQGTNCCQCGGNIRSGALAKAICLTLEHPGTLDQLIATQNNISMLEINEAGTLHSRLSQLPRHILGAYPECDLMALPFEDQSIEMVVHSDTLEHVPDPRRALAEIKRVLVPGGVTIFTVPIIIGRLTRFREGLPLSFHGSPETQSLDFQVVTEFGADTWCMLLEAGYSQCNMVPYHYPAGIAIIAKNPHL
ncbi:MAG: class I SAM-dependent methyltransferase [Gammaproteobacteria bacterium]|jgi:SAM-dependent methyltransferase